MKNNVIKNKLSVVIITKNEEKVIADAIKSSLFADEVIALDSGSTDKTCDISRDLGAKVYHQDWLGFGSQKNKAIELASNDWVFVLDSDERISEILKQEILEILKNPTYLAYKVPRLNNFFGKNIKTCGLYPDYSIRLFNRTKAQFNNVDVHESVQIDTKKVGKVKNHMIHLAYDTISEFIDKQNKYSSLNYKEQNLIKAIFSSYWTFIKLYILKKGFLDGWHGYVISKLYSQYTFWKYIK